MTALAARRPVLWTAFLLVHVIIAVECLRPGLTGDSFNDVTVLYRYWAETGVQHGVWPSITEPWVYPIVALVPMVLPLVAGHDAYGPLWLVLVTALDAVAFAALLARGGRGRVLAAWFWLAAIAALGPVALGRLDIVSVALAMLGAVLLAQRPAVAGAVLALGTWVKFWPAAVIAAAIVGAAERWRVLVGAVAAMAVIVAVGLWLGGPAPLFSFIGQQGGRGLQVESPFATPLLIAKALRVPGATVFYDTVLSTWQVSGAGATALARAADLAMPIGAALAVAVGLRAALRRAEPRLAVALLALALVAAFCGFDKVGSPQYQSWFAVPVALGLLAAPRAMRLPVVAVLVMTLLSQIVYPWHYGALLGAEPWMVTLIAVRNALELLLYGWAVVRLWRLAGASGRRPRQTRRADPTR